MKFSSLQKIVDILRRKRPLRLKTKAGLIHMPFYSPGGVFVESGSNLYNEYGEKLDEFFVRSSIYAIYPYRQSRYFMWDRYNFGLKTHFYSNNFMLETVGKPDKKYGFLLESEAITPYDYKIFKRHKGLEKDFDLIFTHSADILNTVDNARFVPMCAFLTNTSLMVPTPDGENYYGLKEPNRYQNKTKNVSCLSSWKKRTPLNTYRLELTRKCKREGLADTFGTFDGGKMVPIQETLKEYRYTFCIENVVKPYFFTERLISAFANQTIPIYLGATEIDKFFNPDGIIKITEKSDINQVLKQCTKEEYERRLPAILDNFERCKKYVNPFDYMYENYFMKDGKK